MPQEPLTVEFEPEETLHAYTVDLEPNLVLHLEIAQEGLDVTVTVIDPMEQRLYLDSPGGSRSLEELWFVSEHPGPHRLEIRAPRGAKSRRYHIRHAAWRSAEASDVTRAEATRMLASADALRRQRLFDRALPLYEESLELWRRLGRGRQQAIVLGGMATARRDAGELETAIELYGRALRVLEDHDHPPLRIDFLDRLAHTYRRGGDIANARSTFERSRDLARHAGDRASEVKQLNNLALLHQRAGEIDISLELFQEARGVYRDLGLSDFEAVTLNNIGEVYRFLGRPREALEAHREALRLARRGASPYSSGIESQALTGVGWVQFQENDFVGAMNHAREALEIGLAHPRGTLITAQSLDLMGRLYHATDRPEEARKTWERTLELFESMGDAVSSSYLRLALADLEAGSGDPRRALELAGDFSHDSDDSGGKASAQLIRARALRRLDEPARAQEAIEAALKIIEELRFMSRSLEFRRSLFASRQLYYELYIDLLMERDATASGRGFDRMAVTATERTRARGLLDILEMRRRGLTLRYEELTGELYATMNDLSRDRGMASTADLQALLDADTVILSYFLGEERGFLWRIDRDSIETFELPPRAVVEEAALKAYRLLSQTDRSMMRGRARLAARELGAMVLGPLGDRLDDERLVIVGDGALLYIPFAALLKPSTGAPMVIDHEIVTLPSLSVLGVLRRRAASREAAPKALAVVADPVYRDTDERLHGRAVAPSPTVSRGGDPTVSDPVLDAYPRLPYSGEEARALAKLAAVHGQVLTATGFEANRGLVLDGDLHDYRIVHFAAHALLDTESPEKSTIVLSLFDDDGHRHGDGFLRLYELYNLDLSADLVVLSACRTALGRQVRGEGLVGLTRGFMSAGASRVLVSLWSINDQATSEWMQRFYRAHLRDGASAAAAMRQAQLSMLEHPRFGAYHFWAAFVLQGDWR